MTLLEKNKICRTFRAVGHLGTLHTPLFIAPHHRCELTDTQADVKNWSFQSDISVISFQMPLSVSLLDMARGTPALAG